MTTRFGFTIAIRDGSHLRAEAIDTDDLGSDDLARCTDLAHEMLAHLERVSRRWTSRKEKSASRSGSGG